MHPHVHRRPAGAAAPARARRGLTAAEARRLLATPDELAPRPPFRDRDMRAEVQQAFRDARRGDT